MAIQTVTYSSKSQGWTSFWSFLPDWMIGMNSYFYTWKNGELYKHDTNATRNAFYYDDGNAEYYTYPSTITSIFNSGEDVKMFKTLSLDSNAAWDAAVTTDLSTGLVDDTWFKEKEGKWFGYIRRADDGTYDLKSLSTQGIGALTSYTAGTLTLTFAFNIGTSVSVGDKIYKIAAGALVLVGVVASHTSTTIVLVSASSVPSAGDIIVYVKNAQVESYGARGYYMEVLLTNDDTTEVEIFSVGSDIFMSDPNN